MKKPIDNLKYEITKDISRYKKECKVLNVELRKHEDHMETNTYENEEYQNLLSEISPILYCLRQSEKYLSMFRRWSK